MDRQLWQSLDLARRSSHRRRGRVGHLLLVFLVEGIVAVGKFLVLAAAKLLRLQHRSLHQFLPIWSDYDAWI